MKCLINSVRLWKSWSCYCDGIQFYCNSNHVHNMRRSKLLFLIWVLELCRPKKPWEVTPIAAEGLWSRGVRCSFGLTREPSHCCRSFFSHDFSAEMKDAHSFKFLIQQWKTSMICLFCLFPHSLATLSAMRFVPGQWALQGECKQGSQAWFSVLALHSCLASQERLCTLCLSNGCTHSLSGRQLPPFEPDALFKFIPYQRKPGTLQLKHSWHILLEVRTSG